MAKSLRQTASRPWCNLDQPGQRTHRASLWQHISDEGKAYNLMTETEASSELSAAPDQIERHTGKGRNVVVGNHQHEGGVDVFLAAVRLTRMPMCLSDPNLPDNPLVFVNRAFEDLTGYTAEEVQGRNCRFLQGQDTDPAKVDELRRAIAARVDVSVELYNYRRALQLPKGWQRVLERRLSQSGVQPSGGATLLLCQPTRRDEAVRGRGDGAAKLAHGCARQYGGRYCT